MRLMIILSIFSALVFNPKTTAQVAINTSSVDASAALKIHAVDKGVLLPSVSLLSSTDISTISNPTTSLLVYNNTASNDLSVGFYFWNGSIWERLVDSSKAYARASFSNDITSLATNLNTSVIAPIAGTTSFNNSPTLYSSPNNSTVQINEGGRYEIVAHLYLYSTENHSQPYCQLKVNGIPKGAISATGYLNTANSNYYTTLQIIETLQLNAGDQLTVQMHSHYSGSGLTPTVFASIGTSKITVTKI